MINIKHDFSTKEPPLDIISYFFRTVFFEAHPIGFSNSDQESLLDFEVQTSVEVTDGNKEPHGVRLVVETTHQKETKAYDFKVELFGIFSFSESVVDADRQKVLYANGSSILYAAAREMLTTLSQKGPFKAIILPTTVFIPENKQN